MTLFAAAIDWHTFFFVFFALLACGFGLAVLFSSNVVHMAFYLVLSLGATSGLFFLAGAEFVGAMQLMIYVGGTVVLLIFGVMLTAQKTFVSMKTRGGEWVLACFVGGSLLLVLVTAAIGVESWSQPRTDRDQLTATDMETTTGLGVAVLGAHPEKLTEEDEVRSGGLAGYLLPFEIVSVHLLVVLIGAGYLARAKKRPDQVAEH